jgi:hypothetical protein
LIKFLVEVLMVGVEVVWLWALIQLYRHKGCVMS